MATLYEKLAASRPINRAAALSFGRDEQKFEAPEVSNIWEICPPLYYGRSPHEVGTFVNFKGRRFGKLTVVGIAERRSSQNKRIWVCRCDCGKFTGRSTPVLKKLEHEKKPQCGLCDKLEYLAGPTLASARQSDLVTATDFGMDGP